MEVDDESVCSHVVVVPCDECCLPPQSDREHD